MARNFNFGSNKNNNHVTVTDEDKERANKYPISYYLGSLGLTIRGNTCACPLCGKRGKGFIMSDKNKFTCFSCSDGRGMSVIDLHMYLRSVSYLQAVRELNGNIVNNKIVLSEGKKNPVKSFKPNNNKYNAIRHRSTPLSREGRNYLSLRHLNGVEETLKANGIEIMSNTYDEIEGIVYIFKNHEFLIKKSLKRFRGKRKIITTPNPRPVPIRVNSSNKWYVAEGIEDAMSLVKLGYNAITLNSISNVNKFKAILQDKYEWSKKQEFILALDNDEAGRKTQKELIEYLGKIGIKYDLFHDYIRTVENNNLKDVNDYLIFISTGKFKI